MSHEEEKVEIEMFEKFIQIVSIITNYLDLIH